MSMYDTVEIDDAAPFDEAVCSTEWQVHLKSVGATYRITEDLEFLVRTIGLKEDIEKSDDDPIRPGDLEEKWRQTDVDGHLTLNGRAEAMDLVLEEGEIVDYDPRLIRMV